MKWASFYTEGITQYYAVAIVFTKYCIVKTGNFPNGQTHELFPIATFTGKLLYICGSHSVELNVQCAVKFG